MEVFFYKINVACINAHSSSYPVKTMVVNVRSEKKNGRRSGVMADIQHIDLSPAARHIVHYAHIFYHANRPKTDDEEL